MSLFSVAEALVEITKAIREVASVIATPRRERIATAALQGLLASDFLHYAAAGRAVTLADDLIAELDRTAKPTPADEAVRLLARLLPHVGDTARMEDIERASDLVREADGGTR